MWRFTERMVRSTLVTACRLATSPTRTSPDLVKATTDGVVRAPSALAMTLGSPPSRTATTEFVVPRSMPTARDMVDSSGKSGKELSETCSILRPGPVGCQIKPESHRRKSVRGREESGRDQDEKVVLDLL